MLDGLETIKVCIAYEYRGKRRELSPLDADGAYYVIIDIGELPPQKMRGLSVAGSIVLNDGLEPSEFVIVDGTPQKSACKR